MVKIIQEDGNDGKFARKKILNPSIPSSRNSVTVVRPFGLFLVESFRNRLEIQDSCSVASWTEPRRT